MVCTREMVVSGSRGRPRVLSNFLHIPKQRLMAMQALSLSSWLEIGIAR